MAVKVGNSWVSETALTYAKAKSGSGHVRIAKSAFGPVSGSEFYNKHTELFTERHKQYSDRTEYSGADAK